MNEVVARRRLGASFSVALFTSTPYKLPCFINDIIAAMNFAGHEWFDYRKSPAVVVVPSFTSAPVADRPSSPSCASSSPRSPSRASSSPRSTSPRIAPAHSRRESSPRGTESPGSAHFPSPSACAPLRARAPLRASTSGLAHSSSASPLFSAPGPANSTSPSPRAPGISPAPTYVHAPAFTCALTCALTRAPAPATAPARDRHLAPDLNPSPAPAQRLVSILIVTPDLAVESGPRSIPAFPIPSARVPRSSPGRLPPCPTSSPALDPAPCTQETRPAYSRSHRVAAKRRSPISAAAI
jgi:hypothetical protein